MNDHYKYGTLIAKLMGDRISDEESIQLDEWVCADEANMKLFEDLINEFKWKWAKQWFKETGISYWHTRHIKWKDIDGWYKPETRSLQDYYIVAVVVFAVMAGVYLVLRSRRSRYQIFS